jgi:hypothetical protein
MNGTKPLRSGRNWQVPPTSVNKREACRNTAMIDGHEIAGKSPHVIAVYDGAHMLIKKLIKAIRIQRSRHTCSERSCTEDSRMASSRRVAQKAGGAIMELGFTCLHCSSYLH